MPLLGTISSRKCNKINQLGWIQKSRPPFRPPRTSRCSRFQGPLSLLRDGDVVKLCANTGELSTTADLSSRTPATACASQSGTGREFFAMFRASADEAEKGGSAMLAAAGL